jgi:two-component system, NarL family, sensor kinase
MIDVISFLFAGIKCKIALLEIHQTLPRNNAIAPVDKYNTTSLIIIGITAMLALASGIVMFVILYQRRVIRHHIELQEINDKKEQELRDASIQAEEQERTRIAGELHDDIGATLASIRLFMHGAGKDGDNKEVYQQSRQLLDETINKVRGISHSLHPATLHHLGLYPSLQSYFEMITKAGHLRITHDMQKDMPRLPDKIELSIYRIVQELVNNITKHADATVIHVYAQVQGNIFHMHMQHDGRGLTTQTFEEQVYKKGAIGLKNIVNRMQSVNGSIGFSQNEKDYSILINIPLSSTP